MCILIFTPFAYGGLADYAQAQGEALAAREGIEVLWLAPMSLKEPQGARRVGAIELERSDGPGKKEDIISRVIRYVRYCIDPIRKLEEVLNHEACEVVLLASYSEYLAPFWAWRLRRLRRRGIRFGAVVHDPVRDHQVGPRWWHRWSISQGYSFLDVAFVHERIQLDTGGRHFPDLQTVVIPHGIYSYSSERYAREEARSLLDLPDGKPVFLSFGHIRDGKNLNLFLQVMVKFPEIHLVVAGCEQSSGQKPAAFYKDLAQELGISHRIRWHVRHIEESAIGLFFDAADFLLLTYSSQFRSASGVLAAAVHFNKPVLASSGAGPLRTDVEAFSLGEWIVPDSVEAMEQGLSRLLGKPNLADWERYGSERSWNKNAAMVVDRLSQRRRQPATRS